MIGESAENETYVRVMGICMKDLECRYLCFVAHKTFGNRIYWVEDK